MPLFKRKKKGLSTTQEGATETGEGAPSSSFVSASAAAASSENAPPEESPGNPDDSQPDTRPIGLIPVDIDEMLNPNLIGRTINLVQAENWQEDIIQTVPKETEILYENQRGMFFFGKPYFSGKSLIRTFKFDPPPYQRTNTFLSKHPGTIDPSDPKNKHWPPDPEKLYYSPYSSSSGILAMDSLTGHRWKWTQDRWYVDMRGDVDDEGWEYAFYWNGRYRWIGGNWHGKSVLVHGWVRRRRWVRDMHKIPPRVMESPEKETEEIGKPGGGGYDGLLHRIREAPSPDLKRKALEDFFDAALVPTLTELPSYIHHIYILLDPVSTLDLIYILETHPSDDEDVKSAISTSLSFLLSKRDSIPLRPSKLPPLRSLPESKWSTYSPPTPLADQPTRRARLRILRAQWRKTQQAPSQTIRRVRFSDPSEEDEFVTAPESFSRSSLGRSSSAESREEWFVAPDESGGPVERAKSVAGLIREGKMREEAIIEELHNA